MRKKRSFVTVMIGFVLFLSMGGCGLIDNGLARLTTDFMVWPADERILYEQGAESLAREVASHLPQVLESVESGQCGTFKQPVTVYAFATIESFSKFSGISDKARGASLGNEVYLSGILLDIPEEISGMLGHELSHVQLSQTLGTIDFNRTLPRWFREGLAIHVSDGGGSPRNYEQETIEKFLQGRHFVPESTGSLFNRNLKSTDAIGPRMFYSQSGMFVTYLASRHPRNFKAFLTELQRGRRFEHSFSEKFGIEVGEMQKMYINTLR